MFCKSFKNMSEQCDIVINTQKQNNATLAAWKAAHNVSGNEVLTSQLNQQLITGTEPGAQFSISNLQGGQIETNELDIGAANVAPDTYIKLLGEHASFDITYSNLTHTFYKGRPVTSLTEHFDVYKSKTGNPNATNNFDNNSGGHGLAGFSIHISHDPTKGFNLFGTKATLSGSYRYADGLPVNFQEGSAYLSIGSLDNYANGMKQYSIESTTVNYGGRAIGLVGSSVKAHGNTLYADYPNAFRDSALQPGGNAAWVGYNQAHPFQGQYDAHDWDYNGSPLQYYGAGLIALSGSNFSLTAFASDAGIPNGAGFRNWMWWNMTSVIPQTPEPQLKKTTQHYHYDV